MKPSLCEREGARQRGEFVDLCLTHATMIFRYMNQNSPFPSLEKRGEHHESIPGSGAIVRVTQRNCLDKFTRPIADADMTTLKGTFLTQLVLTLVVVVTPVRRCAP